MTAPRAERPDMTDYGVPEDLADVLPWSWAEDRLLRNRNYWVITVSPKGQPAAMPVWGVWLPKSSTFAFSCSPNARKARNIRANPRVAFTIDDTVECVSVEGTARELPADRQHATAVSYAAKYEPDPVKQAEMVTFVTSHSMWEVVPQRAFAVIEREDEFAQRATRWVW